MRAVVCKAYGGPEKLALEELPSPRAARGQVVVSIRAAGVNFPDTLIIEGKYQYKPAPPFSPGAEFAGTVKEVGEGVSGFQPGDAVVGISTWGAFAEEIAIEAERLAKLPPGADFTVAAAVGLTYGTSYYALKDRAQLRAGETLLVLGAAGGVGIAAVELGKMMGARVIAAASSDDKLATCKRYGADEVINYEASDLREAIKSLTDSAGVDVVYDPVGGRFAEPAVRGLAWKGRYLVVGFAAGEIPRIPLNLLLLKGASIVGVFWGDMTRREPALHTANMGELTRLILGGKLRPLISETYPLERAGDALAAFAARRVQGKVVIVNR